MMAYNGLTLAIPLRAAGHRVRFVDLRWSADPEADVLGEAEDSVCVGISAMTGHQIKEGLRWAERLRDLRPDLPLVWGGPHVSILPEQTLRDPRVDYVVRGQGTYAFLDLVEALLDGRDPSRIPGIGFKHLGEPVLTPARPFRALEGFTGYPFDLQPVGAIAAGADRITYNSSEGCPWRCGFCANQIMYGRRWAGFDASTIVEDVKRLTALSGMSNVFMQDTNFFVNKRRVLAFAEAMARVNPGVTWMASVRSDQILRYAPAEVEKLAASGLTLVFIGMESGSPRVVDLVVKDCKVEDYLRSIDHLAASKIRTAGIFMMGIPTETEEERESTRALVRRVFLHPFGTANMAVFTPYPGGTLYELSLQKGFVPPESFEGWSGFSQDKVNLPWLDDGFQLEYDRFIAEMWISKGGHLGADVTGRLEEMARAGHKRILVWGAGLTSARIILTCRDMPISIAGLVDSNPKKWNREWYGLKVYAPDDAPWKDVDGVLIGSLGWETEILNRLRGLRLPDRPLWTLSGGRAAAAD